jgi:peptide methionine sulfoxide reductase MsrA
MTKTAVLAGGCFWGEEVSLHFRKTLPSIFVENTDKVYRFCKNWKTSYPIITIQW